VFEAVTKTVRKQSTDDLNGEVEARLHGFLRGLILTLPDEVSLCHRLTRHHDVVQHLMSDPTCLVGELVEESGFVAGESVLVVVISEV